MQVENQGDNMRTGICSIAVLIGAMGIVADAAASENTSAIA
jgi:hypothetical protein